MQSELESVIRKIIVEEISRQPVNELTPVAEFCKAKNITRVTLWRAEKAGKVKLHRIGRKVFVNSNQFIG